jgi:hypothetical protein
MDVKIKDRKEEIEYLRMALNMCELGIDYTYADLIIKVSEKLKGAKGEFAISDAVEIYHKWKNEWQKYFEEESQKSS